MASQQKLAIVTGANKGIGFEICRRLGELGSGQLTEKPHLVFFLHDEVIVHAPDALAPAVEVALRESAAEAGRLLFGAAPVEFALTVATVDRYSDAK